MKHRDVYYKLQQYNEFPYYISLNLYEHMDNLHVSRTHLQTHTHKYEYI